MNIMRKRHRLDRFVTDTGVLWGHVIPGPGRQSADNQEGGDRDFERQPICPARKKVRHKESADSIFPEHPPPTVIRDRIGERMWFVQKSKWLRFPALSRQRAVIL